MIVVIQCASRKRPDAGCLRASDGTRIYFVADPATAPAVADVRYARPDDVADEGTTYRDLLLAYNRNPRDNPLRLKPACELYENAAYRRLVERFGIEKVYILSAGWGLIGGAFLTPNYDITFSPSAESYKRRRQGERFDDFCMLPDTQERIVFLGGKDYIPLFCGLTQHSSAQRTVFYNSKTPPHAPGCLLERFATTTRTNWHYECANALLRSAVLLTG